MMKALLCSKEAVLQYLRVQDQATSKLTGRTCNQGALDFRA